MEYILKRCIEAFKKKYDDDERLYYLIAEADIYNRGFEENFFYKTTIRENNTTEKIHNCKYYKNATIDHCYQLAIFIDLVAFKAINDRFHHDLGDELLLKFFAFLKDKVKDIDYKEKVGKSSTYPIKFFPFRHGGDEFALLGISTDCNRCEEKKEIPYDEFKKKLKVLINDIEKDWNEKIWVITKNFVTGPNTPRTWGIEEITPEKQQSIIPLEKQQSERQSIKSLEKQQFIIKGLKLRIGIGDTLDLAESSILEENTQRGVINKECMFYSKSVKNEQDFKELFSNNENWKSLREFLIYMQKCYEHNSEAEVFEIIKKNFPHITGKLLKWEQGGAYFFALPIEFDKCIEGIKRDFPSDSKYTELAHCISWLEYIKLLKKSIAKKLGDMGACYLDAKTVKKP